MNTVQDIGEFGLIRHIQRKVGAASVPRHAVITGIGDDCAVLPGGPGKHLLLTCDPVVEGIHFVAGTPPYRVGWKAMARNLSDIAAMSGLPRWAVVSLGLRPRTPVRYVTELYRGIHAVARHFGCKIVGGDTTRVKHEQFVVITLIGEVEPSRCTLRSGAKVGDAIFVTGKLGGSLAGKHLTFTPRIKEARWLTQQFRVHAMIDISDGLASDLQRLVEASGVGFDICSKSVPKNGSLRAALTDGEDFELLFTVYSRDAAKLRTRFHHIGRVIRKPVVLLDGQPLSAQGYDHFVAR